ncbi:MAG: hypothetical protein CMH27_09930 [Micavibrio sp.]|nr:hypothetical protein [Micavibrio sp.]|tara:strand:+ start:226 stop:849 length:624 start_codon:yes stop_codon:yes gene_type:complete
MTGLPKKSKKKAPPPRPSKPVPKAKERAETPKGVPESIDKERWGALFRGQIIGTTIRKFSGYVALADQKAQGLIFMNSILIPVAMNWIENPGYRVGALICIVTAIFSILAALICIYPKRRAGRKPDGTINLLHFGDIAKLKEEDFLDEFLPVYNDLNLLSEAAAKDMHDVARRVIRPKFYWLKLSYIIFFCGNLAAIFGTLYAIWYH